MLVYIFRLKNIYLSSQIGSVLVYIFLIAMLSTSSSLFAQEAAEPTPDVSVGDEQEMPMAILYFKNNSSDKELGVLAKGLVEMLITDLSSLEKLQIVEREEIEKMMSELNLSMTGIIEESMELQIGRMYSAKWLLTGAFMKLGPRIRIDARIIETETGKVLKSVKTTGEVENFLALERDLVMKIAQSLGYETKVVKEKLGPQPPGTLEAAVLYSQSLSLYDQGEIDETIQLQQKILAANEDLHYARLSLGKLYYTKGEIDNAIRELQDIIVRAPQQTGAYDLMGQAYEKGGMNDQAEVAYRKYVRANPNTTRSKLLKKKYHISNTAKTGDNSGVHTFSSGGDKCKIFYKIEDNDADGKASFWTSVSKYNFEKREYKRVTDFNGSWKASRELTPGRYLVVVVYRESNPSQKIVRNVDILENESVELVHYFESGKVFYQIEDNDPDGKGSFWTSLSKYNSAEREYKRVTDFKGIWKANRKMAPGRYKVKVVYRESNPSQEIVRNFEIGDKETVEVGHYFESGKVFYQIEDNDPDGKGSFWTSLSKYNSAERKYKRVTDFKGIWKANRKMAPGRYKVKVVYRESNPSQEIVRNFEIKDKEAVEVGHYFESGKVFYQIEDNDPDGKGSFWTSLSKYNPEEREYKRVTDFKSTWKANRKMAPGRYQAVVVYRESKPKKEQLLEFEINDKDIFEIKKKFVK